MFNLFSVVSVLHSYETLTFCILVLNHALSQWQGEVCSSHIFHNPFIFAHLQIGKYIKQDFCTCVCEIMLPLISMGVILLLFMFSILENLLLFSVFWVTSSASQKLYSKQNLNFNGRKQNSSLSLADKLSFILTHCPQCCLFASSVFFDRLVWMG